MYTKRVERAKTEEMKTDTIFLKNLNKKEYSEKINIKLSNQLLQKRIADEWLAFSLTSSAFKVCEHPGQTGSKYPALPSGTPGQERGQLCQPRTEATLYHRRSQLAD